MSIDLDEWFFSMLNLDLTRRWLAAIFSALLFIWRRSLFSTINLSLKAICELAALNNKSTAINNLLQLNLFLAFLATQKWQLLSFWVFFIFQFTSSNTYNCINFTQKDMSYIWVNFPRTGKMVKMWHFLIFSDLCCDQTVWFFQLFSAALRRFCPLFSKNVFVSVLAYLKPEIELFEVDDIGDGGDDDL